MNLVYITSPSYSGSTLLTLLLASHPRIATIGELKASVMGERGRYNCSCGVRLGGCAFWKELGAEVEKRGASLDLYNLGTHFRAPDQPLVDRVLRARVGGPWFEALRTLALRTFPGAAHSYDAILEKNQTLVDAVSCLRHADVFLDSSKDPVRLRYLAASKLWRVRVVHLLRDGRATAASHMKHHHISMEVAAQEWRRTHEECTRLRKRFQRRSWYQVHYEQLCRNPGETLEALSRFIGLVPSVRSDGLGAVEHHILGNSMRLTTPAKIVLDETWRATLTRADHSTFERLAGDANRRYGYT